MPYFGLTSAFLSSPLLEKCAPYSGFGVRHAPVKVCGLLRSYCAPCSGFCTSKSFDIKGLSITVMAAMVALLARGTDRRFILFALVLVLFFWALTRFIYGTRDCPKNHFLTRKQTARFGKPGRKDYLGGLPYQNSSRLYACF